MSAEQAGNELAARLDTIGRELESADFARARMHLMRFKVWSARRLEHEYGHGVAAAFDDLLAGPLDNPAAAVERVAVVRRYLARRLGSRRAA